MRLSVPLPLPPSSSHAVFAISGLKDGPHEIIVTNMEQAIMNLDYVVFNSSTKPNIDNSTSISSGNASNSASGGSLNVGAIAGGAVGGTVALVLLGLLAWWIWRRKRTRRGVYTTSRSPVDLAEPEVRPFEYSPMSLAPDNTGDAYQTFKLTSHPVPPPGSSLVPTAGSTPPSTMSHPITAIQPCEVSPRAKSAYTSRLPETSRTPPLNIPLREVEMGPVRLRLEIDGENAARTRPGLLPPEYSR